MAIKNYKTFLTNATEHELINMSLTDIMAEMMQHYEDMMDEFDNDPNGGSCKKLMEKRLSHSIILYAEGKRLVASQPELGHKLLMASIFWKHNRALVHLPAQERETVIQFIKESTKKRESLPWAFINGQKELTSQP